jgi:hypothetical protein
MTRAENREFFITIANATAITFLVDYPNIRLWGTFNTWALSRKIIVGACEYYHRVYRYKPWLDALLSAGIVKD